MLSDEIKAEIGNRIRDYRIMNRLTQTGFAEAAGISVNFLSEIENGKRGFSTDTLYYICNTFNISADYILFGEKIQVSRQIVLLNMRKICRIQSWTRFWSI